jgi:signal transduction histidine kinase/CheY-like chemotaxis protein
MRLQYQVLLIISLITVLLTVVIYSVVSTVVMDAARGAERRQALAITVNAEAMLRQPLDFASASPGFISVCDDCLVFDDMSHWVSDETLASLLKDLPEQAAASNPNTTPEDMVSENIVGWTAVGDAIYRYRYRSGENPLLVLVPLSAQLIDDASKALGYPLTLVVMSRPYVKTDALDAESKTPASNTMDASLLLQGNKLQREAMSSDVTSVGAASNKPQKAIVLHATVARVFTEEAQSQIHYLIGLLYVLAIAIAAIAVLMVRYLVIRRVTRLREKAQLIARDGNLEGLFQVSGSDEIRELANDFNRMITVIAQAQQELKQAQQEAEQASAAKSQFLAKMSHEIRTPLTVVLGYADLVADDHISERERRHYIEIIQSHGEQLVGVINDILDLAKIEAGRMSINRETVNIRALTHEITDMMKLGANRKNIELRAEIDPLVPGFLQSDTLRLKQILINLVSNAIKFTFEGSVSIHVRVALSHLQEAHLQAPSLLLDVVDTGIGMSEATMTNLFDAFHQADNSSTRRFGGTGLGLTIAKQLTELLGGELNVDSTLHAGSRFQVSLPLIVPAEDAVFIDNTHVARIRDLRVQPGTRALIVDDNSVIRLLVRKLLARVGFDVEECTDGAEACQRIVENSVVFDLIIMDMHMPEMDGIQATRYLRAAQVTTPIIGLTANVMDADRQRLLDAGCNDFLSKPVEMERFYDVLIKSINDKIVSRSNDEMPA